MEKVYTFVSKTGRGAAASSVHDGSNLPGGGSDWEPRDALDPNEMTASSGIIGIGNARDVLDAVQSKGLFVSWSAHVPEAGRGDSPTN